MAFLESLTDEQAAKQPPLILEQDGVAAQQRREGGRVRCREFATDGASGLGAKIYSDLLEVRDTALPALPCPSCGKRMERHRRAGKTFQTRLGSVRVERSYCHCRDYGGGFHQLDRTAKTSEAKAVICFTADSRDPKTGEPRKDRNSGPAGVWIDSARAVNGVSRISDFAARPERFVYRNALFRAEELVVLSGGAPWIRTVCEEILAGPEMTFILDLFHALDFAAAAVQAVTPDEGERTACVDWIREQLDAGRVELVIAALMPHRDRPEAVMACICCYEANADRMQCDPYRKRGLLIGSGVVKSACKQIVGNRFKKAGCRWSKAGANALFAKRSRPKTFAGPTSSIGGLAAPQPPDQATVSRGG